MGNSIVPVLEALLKTEGSLTGLLEPPTIMVAIEEIKDLRVALQAAKGLLRAVKDERERTGQDVAVVTSVIGLIDAAAKIPRPLFYEPNKSLS